MKLRSFIKRFKRVINLVSVLSNTSGYFLWIQAYLKLFIHSVLLGKIYNRLIHLYLLSSFQSAILFESNVFTHLRFRLKYAVTYTK